MALQIRSSAPRRRSLEHKDRALSTLKQFRLIYGSVRQHFRQIEEACGVSGSQLWLLHEVSLSSGIGVSALATRLSIHQTTCSQLVEKLVARGLVLKTRSSEDQRRVGLSITRAAAQALKNAPGPAEGLLPEALMRLDDASLKSLQRQLDSLIAELRLQDGSAAHKPLADL